MHPQRQRRQHPHRLHHVQVTCWRPAQSPRAVPGGKQHLHILVVQLDPAVGQPHPLPFHQGQDGQQERVRSQPPNSGVAAYGVQQLSSLPLSLFLSEVRLTNGGPLDGPRPSVHEALDLLVAEVYQCAFRQPFGGGPHLSVPHDAAGEGELVACPTVKGVEIDHALYHRLSEAQLPHLVQAVQQHQRTPLLEGRRQHLVSGQVGDAFAEVITNELVQAYLGLRQDVGVG